MTKRHAALSSNLPLKTGGTAGKISVNRISGGISFKIDPHSLAIPDQILSVSYATAKKCAEGYQWLFAKTHPITNKAVFLVEVLFPRQIFCDAVWPALMGEFFATLAAHCGSEYSAWQPDPIEELDKAQFFSRRASIVNVAYTGGDAELDFHLASTSDIAYSIQGKINEIKIEPVLKVLIAAPMLYRLMTETSKLISGE